MGKYQLFYFPVRGRAQATRYLLIDNGIDFEDVNMVSNWPEFKAKMPFGQAPLLKDGDFEVPQSLSMLRYLGKKHGLYPEADFKEAAKVDMMSDHTMDIRESYIRMIYEKYETGKDDFIKEAGGKLQYIEKLFKAWGTDFILSKISFADYMLFDLLDNLLILSSTILDSLPTVKAYYNRMASRPALKKYRETEQFKKMPVSGNGKQ